jgi:hypothetical protein
VEEDDVAAGFTGEFGSERGFRFSSFSPFACFEEGFLEEKSFIGERLGKFPKV